MQPCAVLAFIDKPTQSLLINPTHANGKARTQDTTMTGPAEPNVALYVISSDVLQNFFGSFSTKYQVEEGFAAIIFAAGTR